MQNIWNIGQLSQPPKTWKAEGFCEPGVEALFFESLPCKQKATRSFAWMGVPKRADKAPVPGMVLVHGGGGTAFADWVRLWNSRGYAAIAMDNCGALPKPQIDPRPRHEHSGPAGWGAFADAEKPLEDQWAYHAVADVILAHSLLRSQPGVDPERIGIAGISWGGFLTSITCGVDSRFRLAMPVYGCGFLGENSCWNDNNFPNMPKKMVDRWLELWDPRHYLPNMHNPMCWVTGTNDFAYPLDSLQKSYRLPTGARTLCIRHEMPHGHGGPGERPEELRAFADAILKGEQPLARIADSGLTGNKLWAVYDSPRPILKAEILFTRATGYWQDRKFNIAPAAIDQASRRVEADIPIKTSICYLNLYDDRNCAVSTEHLELPGR